MDRLSEGVSENGMTEEEAKNIIKNESYTNIRKHLEAIQVAVKALGEDCTMADIWKWAEGGDKDVRSLI